MLRRLALPGSTTFDGLDLDGLHPCLTVPRDPEESCPSPHLENATDSEALLQFGKRLAFGDGAMTAAVESGGGGDGGNFPPL